MNSEVPSANEGKVLQLTQHQGALFRYIFSLLGSEADARDVLQETNVALYRKLGEYDAERPFLAWAYRFAYWQVLKHREKAARSPLLFGEDVMDLLAQDRERLEPELDERLRCLEGCLQKLTMQERQMVTHRYALSRGAEEMMEQFSMSRRTLFRNLEMLRKRLHECVSRELRTEGLA